MAQQEVTGIIIDKKTKETIPFVNIGVLKKGVGTTSDESGNFNFMIPKEISQSEIVQISSLGYQTVKIPISQLTNGVDGQSIISMSPENIVLNEVEVYGNDLVQVSDYIGYRNYSPDNFGYWKDNMALGAEMATRIVTDKEKRKLISLEFEVLANPSDSLLLRVNVYRDGDIPGANLNGSQKNILHTLKKHELIVKVDLEPYEIYVSDDFFVSLELVQQYDKNPVALVLAASSNNQGSYIRYASQDGWEKISDLNMAFYLETALLVTQKEAAKREKRLDKKERELKMLSGFTIYDRQMISNVNVYNKRTKEMTISDQTGRYQIHAKKNDIIFFTKPGFENTALKINDQQFANALMHRAD
ncbi:hypothetical protein GCM10011412_10440 [Maribacter cobaltidurans]|nr:hypothetical protein GCM10011412_10440 [Maribacter cobaltidurans]